MDWLQVLHAIAQLKTNKIPCAQRNILEMPGSGTTSVIIALKSSIIAVLPGKKQNEQNQNLIWNEVQNEMTAGKPITETLEDSAICQGRYPLKYHGKDQNIKHFSSQEWKQINRGPYYKMANPCNKHSRISRRS